LRFLQLFALLFSITFIVHAQQSTPLASPTPTPTPLPPPSIKIDGYRAAAARIIGAASGVIVDGATAGIVNQGSILGLTRIGVRSFPGSARMP